MSSKLKSSLKKIPLADSLYQFLRNHYRSSTAYIRETTRHRAFPADHFEKIFAGMEDPWSYQSDHQQERIQLLLEQLPHNLQCALEAGCAEGTFTFLAAKRIQKLIALDLSLTALKRARSKCSSAANVHFVQGDLLHLPFQHGFNAIICAGVLGYLPEKNLFTHVMQHLVNLLVPGGLLIVENRWMTSDGTLSGKSIHNQLNELPMMKCNSLIKKHEYAISTFERTS
jgi:SAM-dependent methyltransferase